MKLIGLVEQAVRYAGKELVYLPGQVGYRFNALRGNSLQSLCESLPCQAHPNVYWTRLENIKYNGLIEASRQGRRFCSGTHWTFPEKHLRPSIFDDIPESTYRWSIHKTVRMIFLEGKSHRLTPQYKGIVEALERNQFQKVVWGCKSLQDVDTLFERMVASFDDMAVNGYKEQRELGKFNRDEIQIYITETGELLKGIGGNHRILMAEINGISWLPIVCHGAHLEFVMEKCQRTGYVPRQAVDSWLADNPILYSSRPG